MKKIKIIQLIIYGLFLSIFFFACGEEEKPDLVPKDGGANILSETETITVDSVKVTVSSDAWTGDPEIKKKVTPLMLSIENENEQPIQVTYDNISLVSEDGDVYHGLPVYDVKGEIENMILADTNALVVESEIDYERFYLYPLYNPIYTDMPLAESEFYEEPGYYKEYYKRWPGDNLPTEEIKNKALPEGILTKGGTLSGFVYFEKVDPDLETVTFKTNLINAETNQVFGTVELPFWVLVD